jgi:hypothetical protein
LCFDNFENLIYEWRGATGQALKARAKVMEACDVKQEMLANPKHVVIGTLLLVLAYGESTFEEVKKVLVREAPYIEVEQGQFKAGHEQLLFLIQDWATACCTARDHLSSLR